MNPEEWPAAERRLHVAACACRGAVETCPQAVYQGDANEQTEEPAVLTASSGGA